MKIDVSQIEGYGNMSVEDKLKALEAYDVPEPDHTGYVTKAVFDATASELAAKKKELRTRMSEDEAARQQEQEERQSMQRELEALRRESAVSRYKAKFIGLGCDEALAEDTANAVADGKTDKLFSNLQKHLSAIESKVRADILKTTPRPVPDGDSKTMTLDALKSLPIEKRMQYANEHPEDYKSLYEGDGT